MATQVQHLRDQSKKQREEILRLRDRVAEIEDLLSRSRAAHDDALVDMEHVYETVTKPRQEALEARVAELDELLVTALGSESETDRWQSRAMRAEAIVRDKDWETLRVKFVEAEARVAVLEGRESEVEAAANCIATEIKYRTRDLEACVVELEGVLHQLTCRYVTIEETSPSGKTQWECTRCNGVTSAPVKYHKCLMGQWDPDQCDGSGE